MRFGRQVHDDRIAGSNLAGDDHDGHHPRQPSQRLAAFLRLHPLEARSHEARTQSVELDTGVPKAGDLHHRLLAEAKLRAHREAEQVEARGGDVLAHLTGGKVEPLVAEGIVELAVDEVHLTQVRLGGVLLHPRAVLDRGTGVGVAGNADPRNERDRQGIGLRHRMRKAGAHRSHQARAHARTIRRSPWSTVDNNDRVQNVLRELEELLRERRHTPPPGSYTAELLTDPERIQRKVMEEAFEVCLELTRAPRDPERISSEAADLVFHLLVGLVEADVPFDEVLRQLQERRR